MEGQADAGLIPSYLMELRQSLGRLPDAVADDVVREAEDHLFEAADRFVQSGLQQFESEARAIARYGSAAFVGRAFVTEARKGAAVATTFTRRCGLMAVVAPLSFFVGLVVSNAMRGGLVNNIAVALAAVGAFGVVPALVGLRVRHGGLGTVGRAAFWMAIVAFPASMPFGYGGLVVLAFLLGASFTLWGVGMFRARVLPRIPISMFGFSGAAFGVVAAVVTVAGGDAGLVTFVPITTTVAGLVWLGWCMWQEGAVDLPTPPAAFAS